MAPECVCVCVCVSFWTCSPSCTQNISAFQSCFLGLLVEKWNVVILENVVIKKQQVSCLFSRKQNQQNHLAGVYITNVCAWHTNHINPSKTEYFRLLRVTPTFSRENSRSTKVWGSTDKQGAGSAILWQQTKQKQNRIEINKRLKIPFLTHHTLYILSENGKTQFFDILTGILFRVWSRVLKLVRSIHY